jgi:hypothetical protein
MESQAFQTISELIGLPTGLQSTLALTLEDHWDLGLFKDLLQNPNGQVHNYSISNYLNVIHNSSMYLQGYLKLVS